MQKQTKLLMIIASVITISLIIAAGYFILNSSSDTEHNKKNDVSSASITPVSTFTAAQLAVFDGKNNADCYVAVSGKVYKIEQGNLWQDGQHTSSNGLAYCGKDLTREIQQSPHGTSKLGSLTIVGTYTN